MSITILDPGLLTTVQDRGRVRFAHLGVPRGGALDSVAAALANRLVGNTEDAAVLETTMTGLSFVTAASLRFAVTGARADVRTDGRARAFASAISVPAGSEVVVGPALAGVRSWVALAGGVAVEPVLGSRSTDTLAWVGPPRVHAGQVLGLGRPGPPAVGDELGLSVERDAKRRATGGAVELRMRRGPRADWMAESSWRLMDGATYEVAADSDRVGLRLQGPLLRRRVTAELASEPMVVGAVQLPGSGQPVVFLADHPVTGGYPVVAVLERGDLGVCAQVRPGERVRLRVV